MIFSFCDVFLRMLLFALRRNLKSSRDLEKENLFLRYQIVVLKRQVRKPKFRIYDRAILATLAMAMKNFFRSCLIVTPETILAWHRLLVRWKWTYGRDGVGRPSVDQEIVDLVLKLKRENRLWGGGRIHGELLKLGFKISETSVRNILRRNGFDPRDTKFGLSWTEFIKRHKSVWAMDFFTVETAFLKTRHVLVIMDICSRQLLSIRVTNRPNSEWVSNVLRGCLLYHESPEMLICDRDSMFGYRIENIIPVKRTPPMSPKCNAYVERLIGTIQRECTNHFLFLNSVQIQKTVTMFMKYYNCDRAHRSKGQKPPQPDEGWGSLGRGLSIKNILGGLHHAYSWAE